MNIVFFGTAPFAAKILHILLKEKAPIVAIVTGPDQPKGRYLRSSPSAVKETALNDNVKVPIYTPEKASSEEFASILRSHEPDLFLVAAYGEIIKTNILSIPQKGCINVHASLLPKYRGAAPMQRALMAGEKRSGITIMEMVLKMDAGPIIQQVGCDIPDTMTLGELEEKFVELTFPALLHVLDSYVTGSVLKVPQVESEVTFAPKITPEDCKIDWNKSALDIHNQIRALSPKPGAWTKILSNGEEKRLKILSSQVVSCPPAKPGTFLKFDKNELLIACGGDGLKLLQVQLEGKKTMVVEEFLRGQFRISLV